LQEAGCDSADILEKSMESGSVLVGDVADEIAADLVLISSEAVHTKQVRLQGRLHRSHVGFPEAIVKLC
jgi:hypothetical protein